MQQRSKEIANREIEIWSRCFEPCPVTEKNKSHVNEMIWRMEHRIRVSLERLEEFYKNPKGYGQYIEPLEIRILKAQEAVKQAKEGNWHPLDYIEYPYRQSYYVGL